ncbi:dienelactone hydrolase family protein [Paractinoplanes ferrugineus]|uniref:DeoR family transcriptional regulator n=1 Tax=Paractinoplanes ferrugineus TaxID=113564 RepID=A0A919M9A8_9ACTN|nr:alpha/beta family hydrolase [Actinoplanes ferrugineus]GIE11326.1 DeoR family transcriptional regulator [Actinoplanes ferrugineus]
MPTATTSTLGFPTAGTELEGDLHLPAGAHGVVLFAHGSGSSRHSPRNRHVAGALNKRGLGTLLVDLLTHEEEVSEVQTHQLRFDIGLLADRLTGLVDRLGERPDTRTLPVGLFGASTGAAAALVAAAERPDEVHAVVSRGGRPDLAGPALPQVEAPTLLIVGERDLPVVELNEQARDTMTGTAELRIVPGATHLFEEPHALEIVAEEAGTWFATHLR